MTFDETLCYVISKKFVTNLYTDAMFLCTAFGSVGIVVVFQRARNYCFKTFHNHHFDEIHCSLF